ncbi:putative isocitrate dehydrogenase [NAD] regulatory subunit 3, mitochondrial [Cocos nucifera]|uniref:Putative isocitrate dehydrogenase [NAD] regulatory subunit 3, mitochondrial n=1 Tax=Cocos nucifera TaxID=13894 RepID=A0A8K0N8V2_COCNU|nr:putative isocitrate dehydrogenase [NAD] regulatory subunit 3, mitochondrial [Cocos nucifera]
MPRPGDGTPRAVTLIPGDGIGPLVTGAVRQVMEAMHAPVYFETYEVHGDMDTVPPEVIESIRKNKVCLKGGLATPVGGGVSSLNVQLRKELDLYASLVHCFNLPGLPTRHQNVDIVVIRENTEGEYSGLEHEVVPGVVESLKGMVGTGDGLSKEIVGSMLEIHVISWSCMISCYAQSNRYAETWIKGNRFILTSIKNGCLKNVQLESIVKPNEVTMVNMHLMSVMSKFCSERIAKYAFEYAYLNNRKKVTAVHKANIMKLADGLFLESCREVATKYPGIKYNEIIVDNCCMQLVSKPDQFDVMVTPNLYGNLVANTAAGIAGGTGVMPGGNVGQDHAVFEQGASAGNVGNQKIMEQKKANPVALLLSSSMMLRHLQFPSFADRLETAVKRVILEGKYRTKDLGGHSTTQEVVDAVVAALD